jgi:hypothetical protein
MLRACSRFGLAVMMCVAVALPVRSGEVPETDLKTIAVAAFKNGLAFVLKKGGVSLDTGTGTIAPIPNATLGSLWIAPNDPSASLDEAVAYRYSVPVRRSLTSLTDVLLANTGKNVTVVDNSGKEFTGEIAGIPDAGSPPASGAAVQPRNPGNFQLTGNTLEVAPLAHAPLPEFLLLKSDGKLLALYLRNIARVVLPENPVLDQEQNEERQAIRFKVKGGKDRATLTMGYLEHGLGWTPAYLISLENDDTAHITMQAVLVNDAEDVKDADVFFVVGVPNFAYADIPSPMALQQSLMDFMQAAARKDSGSIGQLYSNAIMGQKILDMRDEAGAPSFGTTVSELQGAPEEDLFLYVRKGITLRRGERGAYDVFSDTVKFEHVYEWQVEEQPRVDGYGNALNNSRTDVPAKDSIWHTLHFKNTTKFPWTSAPAMVISGTKPLSQDTLPYTPKLASSTLKLTIATDIRASHEEKEVARQQEVQRRRGYSYDEVTVEGTLTVKNYKAKDVKLNITQHVRGTVESQSDGGTADKLAEGVAVDNPLSRLNWTITLKAGEERKITYQYKLWLRV